MWLSTVPVIFGILCSGCMDPCTARVHAPSANTMNFLELLPIHCTVAYIYIYTIILA